MPQYQSSFGERRLTLGAQKKPVTRKPLRLGVQRPGMLQQAATSSLPQGPFGDTRAMNMQPAIERMLSRSMSLRNSGDVGLEMARRETGAGNRIVRAADGGMRIHPMGGDRFPLAAADQPQGQAPLGLRHAVATRRALARNPNLEMSDTGTIGPSALIANVKPGETGREAAMRLGGPEGLIERTFRRRGGVAYQQGDSPRLREFRAQQLADAAAQQRAAAGGGNLSGGGFPGLGPAAGQPVAAPVLGAQGPLVAGAQQPSPGAPSPLRLQAAMQRRVDRQQRMAQRAQPQQGPNLMQMMAMRAMQADPSSAPALLQAMAQAQLGQGQLGLQRQGLQQQFALGQQGLAAEQANAQRTYSTMMENFRQQGMDRGRAHELAQANVEAMLKEGAANRENALAVANAEQRALTEREGTFDQRREAGYGMAGVESGQLDPRDLMAGGGAPAAGAPRAQQSRYGITGLTDRDAEYIESVKGTETGPEDLKNWAQSRGMNDQEVEKFLNDVYGSVFRTADDPYGNWEWWKHGGPINPLNHPQFGGGRISRGISRQREKMLGF